MTTFQTEPGSGFQLPQVQQTMVEEEDARSTAVKALQGALEERVEAARAESEAAKAELQQVGSFRTCGKPCLFLARPGILGRSPLLRLHVVMSSLSLSLAMADGCLGFHTHKRAARRATYTSELDGEIPEPVLSPKAVDGEHMLVLPRRKPPFGYSICTLQAADTTQTSAHASRGL